MRLRSFGFVALAAAAVMQSCQPACTPPPPPPPVTVPAPPPTPTSLTLAGQGSGHGRGLSAWGAYGMALNGVPWTDILATYYGGTEPAPVPARTIGIRLLWADNLPTTVMSTSATAIWNGSAYGSLHAASVGPNTYDVWGSPTVGCGANPGWQLLGRVAGPVTFTTSVDQTNAAAGDVLGLCRPDGTVTHYRGALRAATDGAGATHTINDLLIEDYLEGVLSREVPSSWGNAAGGAGMNSLWAMAVAARSFAYSQNRYPQYNAQTCDTDACQVYGGVAFRRTPDAPTSFPTATQVCESGNLTFECRNTSRAVAETAGVVRVRTGTSQIISGEYSASHGPYSSGVNFPYVVDSASNVPGNPNYEWTRTIAAADIAATYPAIGTFTGAYSERDPSSSAVGVWGNRIVLQGTAGSVTVGNLAFRNAFGFPSHAFAVGSVNV
jgi:SpoIID/LytB domain protein